MAAQADICLGSASLRQRSKSALQVFRHCRRGTVCALKSRWKRASRWKPELVLGQQDVDLGLGGSAGALVGDHVVQVGLVIISIVVVVPLDLAVRFG